MFKYTIDDDNEDGEKETDDGINLEFTLKNIYKPCTSCDEQTTFTDYNLDGIYLEKGKKAERRIRIYAKQGEELLWQNY